MKAFVGCGKVIMPFSCILTLSSVTERNTSVRFSGCGV
jgi:hypothetical protein